MGPTHVEHTSVDFYCVATIHHSLGAGRLREPRSETPEFEAILKLFTSSALQEVSQSDLSSEPAEVRRKDLEV